MTERSNVDSATMAKIADLIASEVDAWNSGDAEAFAARALPDIVFTNVIGMSLIGKAPFAAQHERIFATIYKGSTMHQEIEHIAFLTPDVAIVNTLTTGKGFKELPPGVQPIGNELHTRLQQVLVRQSNEWWIAAFHNVAVSPAASGGPPTT